MLRDQRGREPSLSCQVKNGFIAEEVNRLCVKECLGVLYMEKKMTEV